MILAEEKIFFYHVPKTGGSAIEKHLFKQFNYKPYNYTTFTTGLVQINFPHCPHRWTMQSLIHLPFLRLVELASRSKIYIDKDWDIFTIVRNPYERISSAIFFQSELKCNYNIHTLRTHKEKQFLFNVAQNVFFNRDSQGNNWFNHRETQSTLLDYDDSYNIKVYKYEEGLDKILNNHYKNTLPKPELKLKRDNDHFHDMGFPRTPYNTLWTYDFIKTVNEKYQKDFERFNYQMLDPNDYPKF